MDYEQKKKRQLFRIVVAEVGMVLAVIVIVLVATLAAMGFFISSNGGIEQSGLMQIHTIPTGATVELDGNVLFSRTNLSRTMSAGEHYLKISRDGYDTWAKTVKMYPGVLIRLYYPRLFLQDRVPEEVAALNIKSGTGLEFYAPSRSRNYILYAEKNAAEWKVADIRGDEVKINTLDLSGILPGMVAEEIDPANSSARKQVGLAETKKYVFRGAVEEVKWSSNDDAVLVRVRYEGKAEWVLVKLRNIAESLNLTRSFGLNFEQIEMIDGSANQLFALENQHLRRINTADGAMSRVLLDNVVTFSNHESNVVYVMSNEQDDEQVVGVYRDNEKAGTTIANVPKSEKTKVALTKYYGEDYISYVTENKLTVYYGDLPSYDEKRTELSGLKKLVDAQELSRVPEKFSVSPDGEYLVARNGRQFMVTDLDMGDLYEYEALDSELKWLDASMMYAVKDGHLVVWDFDGTNQRDLAESVKTADGSVMQVMNEPVVITANNRWLYYLVEVENRGIVLTRERIWN